MPPTAGYGAPYRGTGETIFVKDSRTDWTISEGGRPITGEQALEAAGDAEYERRRQALKAHNETLYRVGKQHRRTAKLMILSSVGLIAAGVIGGTILSHAFATETVTPATATDPEMRINEASGTSKLFSALGITMAVGGIVGVGYGFYGSLKRPPYIDWHIPVSMNRPAYIRQQVEPYNDKLTPANPIPAKRPVPGPSLPGRQPQVTTPPVAPPPPPPRAPTPRPTKKKPFKFGGRR